MLTDVFEIHIYIHLVLLAYTFSLLFRITSDQVHPTNKSQIG